MCDNSNQIRVGDSLAGLKCYCLCLIEFISGQATDPHLYFQNKLTADLSGAETLKDVLELLDDLTVWVEAVDPQASSMARLNDSLTDRGLPSFSLMQNPVNRELGRILASGNVATETEYRLLQGGMHEAPGVSGADCVLGERLVTAYESGK
jgi:hypothetical protein